MWQERMFVMPRTPRETQGAGALDGGIREPARFSRTHLAGDGSRRRSEDDAVGVSLMTHAFGKGLRIRQRFLPAGRKGCFRAICDTLDEQGRAGLKKRRRLAHVGRPAAPAAPNYTSPPTGRIPRHLVDHDPSRFSTSAAPEVEITESKGGSGWGAAAATAPSASTMWQSFGSSYSTHGVAAGAGQSRRAG